VTAVWGGTFVVVKESVARVPVYSFNGARFLLAAGVLAVCCVAGLRRLGLDGLRHGALLGSFLFAGYAFQTVGLQYTEASTAGFITGMFVVFTPLLAAGILRRPPGVAALNGVALATVGLGLLSLDERFAPAPGDLLVLGCALSFAAHIVGLGAWSRRYEPLPLTTVQLATAGLLHAGVAATVEAGSASYRVDGYVLGAIALTGLLASAGAFWVQTAAQQVIPPTRTAIVLTMEPVFAGLFGFVLLGERLPARGWVGCGLILGAMLLTELRGPGLGPLPAHDDGGWRAPPARSPKPAPGGRPARGPARPGPARRGSAAR
jgi:drug/metabolite transporter (DMT)-like permease